MASVTFFFLPIFIDACFASDLILSNPPTTVFFTASTFSACRLCSKSSTFFSNAAICARSVSASATARFFMRLHASSRHLAPISRALASETSFAASARTFLTKFT